MGALAALLWSPHYYVVRRTLMGAEHVNLMVFYLHVVFWAAVGSFLILLLTGRGRQLSVFKRNQSHFLVLAASGGYGFWLLRALAMHKAVDSLSHVQVLFYAGPLLLGFMSLLTREPANARRILDLMIGFVGCIMLAGNPHWVTAEVGGSPGFGTSFLALLAAGCWAVFALSARLLVKKEKALPVTAIVLGLGALCLLVTCLTMRTGLWVGSELLWTTVWLGLTSALALGCWLKCLAREPSAAAASLWYLALLFGVVWASWIGGLSPGWFTFWGEVLIVYAAYSATSASAGSDLTMSDLIRA